MPAARALLYPHFFPNGGSSGSEELITAEDFMLAPWDLNKQNRRPDLRPRIVTRTRR